MDTNLIKVKFNKTNNFSQSSGSSYTGWAGVSNIPSTANDRFSNSKGNQYDLAQDGSFSGYTIILLNLCFDCEFASAERALGYKGFAVKEYKQLPSNQELRALLALPNSQLWIISDMTIHMDTTCVNMIYDYYMQGHGVYIWGDNDPYNADANLLLNKLFGVQMSGSVFGDRLISIQRGPGQPGIIKNHPITTGLAYFYEGITVATVDVGQILKPLVYGSAGNIIAAYYDGNGRRALVDGGFTRLFIMWDSAGTSRYVVNAAVWLANI